MPILKVPPAFPVPVLPQVFDTSLSYYELLCKLTEQINAMVTQINTNTTSIESLSTSVTGIQQTVTQMQSAITELQGQIGNVPAEIAQLMADLATERQERISADETILGRINGIGVRLETEFPTFEDLETDYLVGGITFQILTQEEYDALTEYVAKRVYFIWNGTAIIIKYHNTSSDTGATMNTSMTENFNPEMRGISSTIFNFEPDE